MIFLKFLIGLIVIIGVITLIIFGGLGITKAMDLIESKTKENAIGKIFRFIGKVLNITACVFILILFMVSVIALAIYIGAFLI